MEEITKVKNFWESNPLWTGESCFQAGSQEFFEEHHDVYIKDVFAGEFDQRFLPSYNSISMNGKILDLGCGAGFWTYKLAEAGYINLYAADLTESALELTKKRLELYGYIANVSIQNAENLSYESAEFDFINCQGVVHHTPNTEAAISEIARVLKPNGAASISVYYRNLPLRLWPYLAVAGKILSKFGGGLMGRGREEIFSESDPDEIVRLYDGKDNPIGKSYSKDQFIEILEKHFLITDIYFHFFPARALPFKIPKFLHKILDRQMGFLIFANVKKKHQHDV
jgi:2-polyprenyl-3-methyl-5-hydroxy-6-metoxy-1,4-benzoquinol methylase